MQKRWDDALRGGAWLVLAVLLASVAASAFSTMDHLFGKANVRYREEKSGYTAKELRALREAIAEDEAEGEAVGWVQTLSQRVSVKETAGEQTVDALWIDGDPSLILNLTVRSGQLSSMDGAADCALDERTALLLFGSLHVIGETVQVNGVDLTVRGIFALPEGLPALMADPGRGLMLADFSEVPDGLGMTSLEFSVRNPGGLTPAERAQEWMNTAELIARGTIEGDADQRTLYTLLIALPACLAMVMTVWLLARALIQRTDRLYRDIQALRIDPFVKRDAYWRISLRYALQALVLLSAIAAAIALLPRIPMIPPSYLPTRWSDFSFYTDRLKSAMESAALQAFQVALRPALLLERLAWYCRWLPLLSLFSLARAGRALRRAPPFLGFAPSLLLGLCALAAAPVSLLLIARAGFLPEAAPGMLALSALWILVRSLVGANASAVT